MYFRVNTARRAQDIACLSFECNIRECLETYDYMDCIVATHAHKDSPLNIFWKDFAAGSFQKKASGSLFRESQSPYPFA